MYFENPPELNWWKEGLRVAGVDEAGRGAWAGPIVVGVVILPVLAREVPFRDSKTLSPKKREDLLEQILTFALASSVGVSNVKEVERYGVLAATHRAASRAILALGVRPHALLTDYLKLETDLPILSPAKADRDSPSVAAASILAKVTRDRLMLKLAKSEPRFAFEIHKGYGTQKHQDLLRLHGPCRHHRDTFAPIKTLLEAAFAKLEQD